LCYNYLGKWVHPNDAEAKGTNLAIWFSNVFHKAKEVVQMKGFTDKLAPALLSLSETAEAPCYIPAAPDNCPTYVKTIKRVEPSYVKLGSHLCTNATPPSCGCVKPRPRIRLAQKVYMKTVVTPEGVRKLHGMRKAPKPTEMSSRDVINFILIADLAEYAAKVLDEAAVKPPEPPKVSLPPMMVYKPSAPPISPEPIKPINSEWCRHEDCNKARRMMLKEVTGPSNWCCVCKTVNAKCKCKADVQVVSPALKLDQADEAWRKAGKTAMRSKQPKLCREFVNETIVEKFSLKDDTFAKIPIDRMEAQLKESVSMYKNMKQTESVTGKPTELGLLYNSMQKVYEDALQCLSLYKKANPNSATYDLKALAWNGVAGSSKTGSVIEVFDNKRHAYITQTSAARSSTASRLRNELKIADPDCWTYEIALLKSNLATKKFIFLDEVYLFSASYIFAVQLLSKATIVLVGDLAQCMFHDPDPKCGVVLETFEDYLKCIQTVQTCKLTRRFSQNICEVVKSVVPNYKIDSISENQTQLYFMPYEEWSTKLTPRAERWLTFSDATCQKFPAPGCLTVKSAQGSTFSSVNLIITAADLQSFNQPDFFIVSMTRATKVLTIIEAEPGVKNMMPIDFEVLLNLTRPIVTSDNEAVRGRLTIDRLSSEKTSLKSTDFNTALIQPFFEKVPEATMLPFYIPLPSQLPGKIKINPEELNEPRDYQYRSILPCQIPGRPFRVSSRAQTTRTFISRMAVKQRMKLSERTIEMALKNFEAMYLKKNWKMTDIGVTWDRAVDSLIDKYAKAIRVNDKDFKIDTSPGTAAGHLKTIVKLYVDNPEKIMSGKAGQPIVAWAGAWNLLFGPLFRTLASMLQEVFNDNTMYANGLDPAEFEAKMRALITVIKGSPLRNPRTECLDFEQYDASQDDESIQAEWKLVKRVLLLVLGNERLDMIDSLYQLFFLMKKNMRIFCGSMIIDNEEKNTSGNPGTFLFNTLLQMLLWAAAIPPHKYGGGAFGGDDSFINTNKPREEIAHDFLKMNLSIKWDGSEMPMFFNCFIDPANGSVVYDPLRLLWALCSKNFYRQTDAETDKYIEELKLAVADKMKVWQNEMRTVRAGLFYRHSLNEGQIDLLMEALQAFMRTPAPKIRKQLYDFKVHLDSWK